ncbi:MAG: 50S ribosomal protein L18 [Candidatus Levybacteria bacterium RIFCSPHIGHO2_02_FULL_40_18]|nr:MAG: 50S ribosomal protein L18 [Candidatus Levybacteria bacterium RIFCSPHIGHO2_01_FULL_40_58]OGH26399.1 MAG: 50S ribosomal protein L18 [Candidatus Levybacteria bacterium RIFCSPHIGHO2_02_FULL_40_18]OGH31847.1 MAG: 50S ribosomal protein L18 [Candidatus Levybacteria bacterium RIFCSPHIGHO2_12_FULL_40_31]OGH40480.1 MAG: 50S ribosomal protein L18 [Candidatus Levybacteria bacterium RIFCSPLOWO2_01_FULL_40_64]OGH49189.1 MAG: 50S ribosomal protein L18 [Candidatus Levybacteria bacterium RIFCSPLOWO2_02_
MRKEEKIKKMRKLRRIKRVRRKILANKRLPRLTVFRSNKYIYAQIIDDKSGKSIVFASEKEIDTDKAKKTEKAAILGRILAQKAKKKKIDKVIFDKGSYKYHGRIKALAEGAREGGLVF